MDKHINKYLLLFFSLMIFSCDRDEPKVPSVDTTVKAVTLLTPTVNQVCEGLPVIFTWQATAHALKYNLVVSKVENGQETVVLTRETTSTSISVTELEKGKLYKWKIEAVGPKNSAVSAVQQFQTESAFVTNHSPFAPQLVSPADGGNYSIAGGAIFTWTCSDPDNDPITYDIYLSENGTDFQLVKSAHTTTDFLFTGLSVNKTYYWKVVAIDSKGNKTIGQKWSFNTVS